jgi:DNA-binding MarR family transcriptional regulator
VTATTLAAAEAAGEGYVLEAQVGHLLRRAHQRATAIFMAELGDAFDLTPTQYAVLVKLHDGGEQSQNRLGRLTAMDPATAQGVIRRLEERRLVERAADAGDRRRTLLRLTGEGAALVRAAMARGAQVSAATLAPLTPAEQARFLALLRKLA